MADSEALGTLARDLSAIFGGRLVSLLRYGGRTASPGSALTTLAVVDRLTVDDLRACAARAQAWQRQQLATPLLLGAAEFVQSLDAFPFEFGAILDDYAVVSGSDPLHGLRVDASDLRRVCEVQIRSHLLHLRQAFIETQGQNQQVAALISRSAAPLAALLRNISRLNNQVPLDTVLSQIAQLEQGGSVPAAEAGALFAAYLPAVEHLTLTVDRWSGA